uniref:Uncharacterized protein n=1 Tax=Sinocyclocheilus anshuiensis TaxID=1608454 RepID=A0A671L6L6_9TELE
IYYYKEFWLVDTQATGLAYACLFIDSMLCSFVDCKIKLHPPEMYIGFLLQSKADPQSERLNPFFVLGFPFVAMRLAFTFFICLWFIQTGYRP